MPLLALTLVLASAGCQRNYWKPERYAGEPKPNQTGYIIMPTDYLGIAVWKNNDLSVKVRVRPDGNITMPLVGEVQAAGMTIVELRDKIAKKLCQFIQCGEAPISVNLLQVSGYKFTVVGKVERPGTFAPKDYVTLLDALALAGGTTRFADSDGIVIIRKAKDGSQYEIPVSYELLKTGKALYMNIVLLGGDIVSVP
jgi:polysaccharide export outer membrane protein